MPSCILWQNNEQTITILDIPRSLEEAQGSDEVSKQRRLISETPLQRPHSSLEPRSAKALKNIPQATIQELLLTRHLQLVLDQVKKIGLERFTVGRTIIENGEDPLPTGAKRKLADLRDHGRSIGSGSVGDLGTSQHVFRNDQGAPQSIESQYSSQSFYVPTASSFLLGDLLSTAAVFAAEAPKFNAVIMDPPWPNRSAKRSKSYEISSDNMEIYQLLSSIPLHNHLTDDALVGVWITNRPAFREIILAQGGLFERWGLRLVEEWVWLKVTESGEPMCALNGVWRKPYEILLLAKRVPEASPPSARSGTKRRIIVAVPDLHSRKPNLRAMLEPMLPKEYVGLEIFARNLTTGWWSWGNEVLKFQEDQQWLVEHEMMDE